MAREHLTIEDENGELIIVPSKLAICDKCKGEGAMENPAFSNGFTSSEWHNMDGETQDHYMSGAYDVPCDCCAGRGMVRVHDIGRTSFAIRRLLVLKRREDREDRKFAREDAAIQRAEMRMCYGADY